MDTFSRIRSGIAEIKKEKEELKSKYDFLEHELGKLIEANSREIRRLAEKSGTEAADMAAVDQKIKKIDSDGKAMGSRLADSLSALTKQAAALRESMLELSGRVTKAQASAEVTRKEAAASVARDEKLTGHLESLQQRVISVESLRDRIKEIEKAGDSLVRGVKQLEDLRGSVSSAHEHISALRKSINDKEAGLDNKLMANVSAIQSDFGRHGNEIKGLESGINGIRIEMQALRKDLDAENASIGRVRKGVDDNKRKLELIGTLQAQIKNIEDIKATLVREVTNLKDMHGKYSLLEQRTRDLDSRLTSADRQVEAKVMQKTRNLDRQLAEKLKAFDSQVQERLQFLSAGLDEKGKTLQSKLVELSKRLEGNVSAEMHAVKHEMAGEAADLKRVQADLKTIGLEIKELKEGGSSAKTGIHDIKGSLERIGARVNSLEAMRERVKAMEDAKDALIAGMGDVGEVKDGVTALTERVKSVESSANAQLGAAVKGLEKGMSAIKADQSEVKRKVRELEALRQKTSDIENLEEALSKGLEDLKPVQRKVTAMTQDINSLKRDLEDNSTILDNKMDYNVTALKKQSGFNAAGLAKLDQEMHSISLDMEAVRKDWQANRKDITEARSTLNKATSKLAQVEKLGARLQQVEQSKQQLSDAMDGRLEDKMKFIEMSMRQRGENIEADVLDKARALEKRIATDMAGLRKQISSNDRSIGGLRGKLSAIGRLEERLRGLDKDKAEIARSVGSLQGLQTGLAEARERGKALGKELSGIKAGMAKELGVLKGQIDETRTGDRAKFDSAVKAFLNTRGDLNGKLQTVNVKLSDLDSRINDLSRSLIRIDVLEKKLDRMVDRSADMRRDVDKLESKGEAEEKVMYVDLDKAESGSR